MIRDVIGMILSIVFVFVVIVLSEIISKKGKLSPEGTRKFIHIGVSNWWIVAMILIKDIKFAVIPPIIFIILNYISYKKNLIKSMERNNSSSDLGTIYFPISLLVLILLFWKGGLLGDYRFIGGIGILIMGYGDGFAAIVGKAIGKNKYKVYNNYKTIEGSFVVFMLSFIVSILGLGFFIGFNLNIVNLSITIALLATLLEGLTPYGFDNLTVPIVSSLGLYYLINIASLDILNLSFSLSIGLLFSMIIAYLAYKKKSLSLSGGIGAIILGTGIYATSGIYGSFIMIAFFISSSILSHFKREGKRDLEKRYDKTGKRDIYQVFANGGVGLIYSIIYFVTKESLFLVPLAIAFAAANCDTWSTELGALNKGKPLSLRNFKRVDKGTSGAISFIGTMSGLFGSIFIGLFSVILLYILGIDIKDLSYINIFIIISLGGFIGGLLDSLLGATLQGIYFSKFLGKETEKKVYNGEENKLIRGYEFFNNDVVNFLSILIASTIFLLL